MYPRKTSIVCHASLQCQGATSEGLPGGLTRSLNGPKRRTNSTGPESQVVVALGQTSQEISRESVSLLQFRSPPTGTLPLPPLLGRAGTFVIRNRCTQLSVVGRRLGDEGAGLFLGLRSLWSSARPVWLRCTAAWTGSMVAPWAALPAGAFVAGQAEVHGRELLAELPLVSELPFFSRGTGSGAPVGLGLRLPRGFHPGGSWRVGEPSSRSWGSEAYCACLPATPLGANFGSRGRLRRVGV